MEISRITAPRVEWRKSERREFRLFAPGTGLDFFLPGSSGPNSVPDTAAAFPAVRVIDEVQVSGYDAVILKAEDPTELLKWLEEHKYAARPALLEWLEKYTSNGWYITAFRVSKAGQNGAGRAVARPVRMTFQTDRPFYPYREPTDARKAKTPVWQARLLRLFVLAGQKMEARIGETDLMPATTVWAGRLEGHHIAEINQRLNVAGADPAGLITGASSMHLTELEDTSSPRLGTDELFLTPATNQSDRERPPVINQYTTITYSPDLPKWPFWIGGISCVAFVVRRLRHRRD